MFSNAGQVQTSVTGPEPRACTLLKTELSNVTEDLRAIYTKLGICPS